VEAITADLKQRATTGRLSIELTEGSDELLRRYTLNPDA
jgi:hypothetical protein